MTIVVHHAGEVNPATLLALAQERLHHRTNDPPHRPPPLRLRLQLVYCDPALPHAYGDSLTGFWERGEGFINLEADVAPWPGALTELWYCPEPWCALPIIVHDAINERNLGVMKFSSSFIAHHPDVWRTYPRNAIFDWRSLDAWLYEQLRPQLPHRHLPPALHLNERHVGEGLVALDPRNP
jgi:hypothetical protein